MRDENFKADQWERRYSPHIAPINELVDALREADPPAGRGWMPYVAPLHGGIDAEVLSILRDPGPKAHIDGGSGFLCIENDDPTAERQAELFDSVGVSPRKVLPWNAYPWYVNRAITPAEQWEGVDPLLRLMGLVPTLSVVFLQGNDARDMWKKVRRDQPGIEAELGLTVIESIHPSRSALRTPDLGERARRLTKQRAAYERLSTVLQGG